MQSRLHEFERLDEYFDAGSGAYASHVVIHKVSQRPFLLTEYNLSNIQAPSKLLYQRVMFLCKNFRMFRCEAVFFQHHISSLSVIKPQILGKYLKTFYVVEPFPMVTLADYAAKQKITPEFLSETLPNLLNTLSALHSVSFPYLALSPLTIIVDGVLWLRPPPLSPYVSPKNLFPPPPKLSRPFFRSSNEQRFYRAPEYSASPPFIQSDCWSLGAILAEYLLFDGPLFGSLSINDQMLRTQAILGPAPAFLNWPPSPPSYGLDLPSFIKQMLDYDPRLRPSLCPHFAYHVLEFIASMSEQKSVASSEDRSCSSQQYSTSQSKTV